MQTEIFQQKYGKKMTILSKSSIVIESGIILTEKMRRKIQQEEERMRGVETRIQEIRHAIFTEVAKMAYDVDSPVEKTIEEIPYRVIPGEVGNFRNDVFLERAIVGERLRLAMGLPCRSAAEHAPISDNIKLADEAETYYTPPLINVIKFACNACHEKRVLITEGCQGCLAHPCVEVCPKKADLKSRVDDYRIRNYRLQQSENVDLYDAVDSLERDSYALRKSEKANAYLEAELEVCKMVQKVQDRISEEIRIGVPEI